MSIYTDKTLQHFRNPKNQGSIPDPDGVGEVGNAICGDIMKLYIKVKDNKISEIKFETLGCAAAIATSSVLTEMVKGKSLDEALKVTREDVTRELGGLPPHKIHCSILAVDALRKAIEDYKKK